MFGVPLYTILATIAVVVLIAAVMIGVPALLIYLVVRSARKGPSA